MNINIRTQNINGLEDKTKGEVAVLLLRMLNQEYKDELNKLHKLIDSLGNNIKYCSHCYNGGDIDSVKEYMFCRDCDKRGFCLPCTIGEKRGYLISRPWYGNHRCCENIWVCESCRNKNPSATSLLKGKPYW